jgi:hypothetical protein
MLKLVPQSAVNQQSALSQTEDTLADRQYFGLNAEQWEAF